jgi:hypothetical protein
MLMNGSTIILLFGRDGGERLAIADTGDFGDGRAISCGDTAQGVSIWRERLCINQRLDGTVRLAYGETSDFNGDGRAISCGDIRTVSIWLMNGFTIQSSFGQDGGNDWHVADTSDFNGEKSDILWRLTPGQSQYG